MPDTYKVFTTNQPNDEKEVDAAEVLDLSRLGLLVPGKGDINGDGEIKRPVSREAPPEDKQILDQITTPKES